MNFFTCPICGAHFTKQERTLVCPNGHTYDLAKKGYVNLLRPGKSAGARHGDDKRMVSARSAFLGSGAYDPLCDAVTNIVCEKARNGDIILDAGCGEGFYTSSIHNRLAKLDISASVYGIDVSRDAISACATRNKEIRLAVASIFDIPAAPESIDILINLFAPYDNASFSRVLKTGGTLLRVFPRERHLWELKEAIYDVPYENQIDTVTLEHFTKKRQITLDIPLFLSSREQIQNLFMMTPYYYKTGRDDQKKLEALDSLQTHAEFLIVEYQK